MFVRLPVRDMVGGARAAAGEIALGSSPWNRRGHRRLNGALITTPPGMKLRSNRHGCPAGVGDSVRRPAKPAKRRDALSTLAADDSAFFEVSIKMLKMHLRKLPGKSGGIFPFGYVEAASSVELSPRSAGLVSIR